MRITKPVKRWFSFKDDPDGGQVEVEHLSPGAIQDIVDKVFVQKVEYKPDEKGESRSPTFSQSVDKGMDRELTVIAAVTAWEKHFDAGGKPLTCTDKNKRRAIREIDGWIEAVNEFRGILAADIEKERKGQKKN